MVDTLVESCHSTESYKSPQNWSQWIAQLHLYDLKGESLFKSIGLWISWGGGVYNQNFASAYFLFSSAIIMEYAVQLVLARKILPKILPLILVLSNSAIFVLSCIQLINKIESTNSIQFFIELGSLIVITFDTILVLILESPNHIEANISTLPSSNV